MNAQSCQKIQEIIDYVVSRLLEAVSGFIRETGEVK
jgi:hypothetical protein